jgi:multiple sugar transport system substrate-binding protein
MVAVTAALISGGMYDRLYDAIEGFTQESSITVDVAFRAPHPELNAHLAESDTPAYDLVSTHTKYAPSQRHFLAALDAGAIENAADFYPAVIDLTTIDGALYGIPRNIDVRLLHYRTDLISQPPTTGDELLAAARAVNRPPYLWGFVFPGRDSGLFGTFYELAESAGARLFPETLVPELCNDGGRWALNLLKTLIATGWYHPRFRLGTTTKCTPGYVPGNPPWFATGPVTTAFMQTRLFRGWHGDSTSLDCPLGRRGNRWLMVAAIRSHWRVWGHENLKRSLCSAS